jgi:DNA-binding GntR family transcriptional regulator
MTPKPSVLIPTVAQLRTHSLTGVVQHEIERMILSGELAAGTRLNENAIAAKLSVSRGPVREACRALEELGFVYLVRNRGVFVKRLDKVEAMEIYDLRAGLTAFAGSLLAPIVQDEHVVELERLLGEMDGAANAADFSAFYPLNLEFHDVIVEATGNGRLMKTYRGLVKEFHLFRSHGLVQQGALMASNEEHRAIVDALKKNDAAACYAVSFHHVANGKQRMLTALDNLAVETDPNSIQKTAAAGL